jgi:cytosine/adenosine deaminase-related metal-dependent hydrolase
MELLRAATRNIALAYGKDDELGTLEPGKHADMLILDHDPLLSAKNYRSIRCVIKDGVLIDHDALPSEPILTRRVTDGTRRPGDIVTDIPTGNLARPRM